MVGAISLVEDARSLSVKLAAGMGKRRPGRYIKQPRPPCDVARRTALSLHSPRPVTENTAGFGVHRPPTTGSMTTYDDSCDKRSEAIATEVIDLTSDSEGHGVSDPVDRARLSLRMPPPRLRIKPCPKSRPKSRPKPHRSRIDPYGRLSFLPRPT